MIAESFYKNPVEFLREKFLATRSKEFESFVQDLNTREQVASKFRALSDLIAAKKADLDLLAEHLEAYSSFDPELTVFNAVKANDLSKLRLIVNEVATPILLKQLLPGIISLAKSELGDIERTFSKFKTQNAKVLAEMGLTS